MPIFGALIAGGLTLATTVYATQQAKKLQKSQEKAQQKANGTDGDSVKKAAELAKELLDPNSKASKNARKATRAAAIASNATAPTGTMVPVENYASNVRNLVGGSHKATADRAIAIQAAPANDETMKYALFGGLALLGIVLVARR